jgi:carbon starvation protein
VDAGTRVARYVLHELLGNAYKPLGNQKSIPAGVLIAAMVVLGWGYLIYTGNISTIWPLFGAGNQLLATIALAVATVFLVNMGKSRYAWVTAVPAIFVGVTTVVAGILSIRDIFWPLTKVASTAFQGYLDSSLMAIFIAGVILVAGDAVRRIWKTLRGAPIPVEAFGPSDESEAVKMRCC